MAIRRKSYFKNYKVQQEIANKYKTITIGLIGVRCGVGVSHLAFLLATYFNKQGNSVALVEVGESRCFSQIEEALHGQINRQAEQFKMKKMTFYKNYLETGLGRVKQAGYSVILVDFGKIEPDKILFFNEMDIGYLVGYGNDWRYQEIIETVTNYPSCRINHIIVNLAGKEEIRELAKAVDAKVMGIDFIKEPFEYSKQLDKNMKAIIGRN